MLAMPFPTLHHLLSFGGTLAGDETWTMGLRLIGVGTANEAAEEALMTEYAAALEIGWAAQGISANSVKLTWAKLNQIGLDGKYTHDWTTLHDFATPVAGGGGGAIKYPNQVSLVATLTTNAGRGLAHAGRVFFPVPGLGVDTDGRMVLANATFAANSCKTFLDTINAVGPGSVGVVSKVRSGAIHTVTGVAVGRVLDTMRSRRTSLAEERQPAALAESGFGGGGGPF